MNTDNKFAVDKLLKRISKTQDVNDIYEMLNEGVHHSMDSIERRLYDVNVLILRALTDKGFKSLASVCSQEYYNDEDLDGDGQIYGVDFIFRNPPPILANMQLKKTKWSHDEMLDWNEFKKERL